MTSIATSGAITYTTGNLLGRATISGTIIFETDLGMITPQFLAVDTDASVWVVGPNPNGGSVKVVKADASGALQWTLTIDAPSCSDTLRAVRLSAAGALLVATEACSEGRVHRISANGQVVWQRVIGGTVAQPFVQVGALAEDTAGNVFVGACTHNGSLTADNARAASLVASWSGSGSERWNLRRDLFGDAPECVTSLDTDTDGSVYAASSVTRGTSPPVLWAIAASGSELWRHAGLLAGHRDRDRFQLVALGLDVHVPVAGGQALERPLSLLVGAEGGPTAARGAIEFDRGPGHGLVVRRVSHLTEEAPHPLPVLGLKRSRECHGEKH